MTFEEYWEQSPYSKMDEAYVIEGAMRAAWKAALLSAAEDVVRIPTSAACYVTTDEALAALKVKKKAAEVIQELI